MTDEWVGRSGSQGRLLVPASDAATVMLALSTDHLSLHVMPNPVDPQIDVSSLLFKTVLLEHGIKPSAEEGAGGGGGLGTTPRRMLTKGGGKWREWWGYSSVESRRGETVESCILDRESCL